MKTYGLENANGTANTAKKNHISSVVVSVLQAGAFFGALVSAPVSGKHAFAGGIVRFFNSNSRRYVGTARLGRKKTLLSFCAIFSVGAVSSSTTVLYGRGLMALSLFQALQTALGGNRGLNYLYAGRVIAGFAIGGISAVAPTFVSECAPKEVRGRITGVAQVMVAIGVMLSYWINCELPYVCGVFWD